MDIDSLCVLFFLFLSFIIFFAFLVLWFVNMVLDIVLDLAEESG
jgi:hypothetical protein